MGFVSLMAMAMIKIIKLTNSSQFVVPYERLYAGKQEKRPR